MSKYKGQHGGKRVKKIGQGSPPTLFGQCPKENIFSLRRASLRFMEQRRIYHCWKYSISYKCSILEWLKLSSIDDPGQGSSWKRVLYVSAAQGLFFVHSFSQSFRDSEQIDSNYCSRMRKEYETRYCKSVFLEQCTLAETLALPVSSQWGFWMVHGIAQHWVMIWHFHYSFPNYVRKIFINSNQSHS